MLVYSRLNKKNGKILFSIKISKRIKENLFTLIIYLQFICLNAKGVEKSILLKCYSHDIKIKIKNNSRQENLNLKLRSKCPDEIFHINGTKLGNKYCTIPLENNSETSMVILKWNQPIDGYTLFYHCDILEIDFLNSTFISLEGMFHGCNNLTSINFSNVNTTLVKDINNVFYDCKSLKSLDLSKLDLSNVIDFRKMFNGCENLEYINFINYNESKIIGNYLTLDNIIPPNLVICINVSLAPKLYESLKNRTCTVVYCGKDWKTKQKKMIDNNTCVDNCFQNNDQNFCPKSENNTYTNKTENSTEIIYETIKNIIYMNESVINRFFYESKNNTEKKLMVQNLINEIKKGSFKELLKGNDTEIIKEIDNEIYQITTLVGQLNSENISTINLGDCEEKLKSSNNIASDEDLVIFKIAHLLPEFKTQILEYSIFSIEGNELNLDSCDDSKIRYDIPIEIDETNLFRYNPNSDFYNDICFQYNSKKGFDLTQYDRKKEFNEKKNGIM